MKGISQATAVRIKAALNLGLRLNIPNEERPMINSPADAAALLQYEMGLLEKEHLKVILLDRRNRVLDIVQIYEGSVNSSQVRIAEVFRPAIQRMASTIIACHNHPSSDNTPSPDDVAVTRAMVQAGKLLGIEPARSSDRFIARFCVSQRAWIGLQLGNAMCMQLTLDFTFKPQQGQKPIIEKEAWLDVSDIARGVGFTTAVQISVTLNEALQPLRNEIR